MAYTVKQVAAMSGVSVRTLHFYDETGLLKPAYVGANGYRFYEEPQLGALSKRDGKLVRRVIVSDFGGPHWARAYELVPPRGEQTRKHARNGLVAMAHAGRFAKPS